MEFIIVDSPCKLLLNQIIMESGFTGDENEAWVEGSFFLRSGKQQSLEQNFGTLNKTLNSTYPEMQYWASTNTEFPPAVSMHHIQTLTGGLHNDNECTYSYPTTPAVKYKGRIHMAKNNHI